MTEMKMAEKAIRIAVLLCCLLIMNLSIAAAETSPREEEAGETNAVALARFHKVSGGRFSGSKKGIRYIYKDKHYESNTWAQIGRYVYRFDDAGYVKRGAFTWNKKTYRADKKGILYINRLYTHRSKKYYYGPDGVMARSAWVTLAGREYFFGSSGSMAKNCWVGEYHTGKSGEKDSNCILGKYYLGPTGKRVLISSISGSKDNKRLIIIGASRVVQMAQDVSDDTDVIYFAKSGEGYSWLKNTVYRRLTDALKLWPCSTVVIQLGNNDISRGNSHLKDYIGLYKKLIRKYPKASFCFMDALPSKGRPAANAKRAAFNRKLTAAFPSRAIGGYDYMERTGYEQRSANDHGHYDAATNRRLFSYILSRTGWKS